MAKKREYYFKSCDKINRVHAIEWAPEDGNVKAVIQIVHGMAEHIDRYEDFALFMAEKGFLVTGEDHLGHGKTAATEADLGYFASERAKELLVGNVHKLKKYVQSKNGDVPYFILGHSMGSYITRKYIAKYGSGITGAVIVGTGFENPVSTGMGLKLIELVKSLKGERYKSSFITKIMFGNYMKRIPNPKTSSDWICTDDEVVSAYKADPFCDCTFTINGYETLVSLVREVCSDKSISKVPKYLPVYFVAGAEDPVGTYGVGVMKAFEKFRQAGIEDVDVKIYPGMRHEILNEKGKAEVYADVLAWIEDHMQESEPLYY